MSGQVVNRKSPRRALRVETAFSSSVQLDRWTSVVADGGLEHSRSRAFVIHIFTTVHMRITLSTFVLTVALFAVLLTFASGEGQDAQKRFKIGKLLKTLAMPRTHI